ncbi:LacI family DNA-binding transcriptional regulator [Naasia sp. SYSU D00948]|uniref:LacI family DNA-binding transcriptional regulator n=1 Tax=Naasia sp. SYSU D00948 TaxID=2817379 RepID=UPI0027DE2071|nr:LacI family DNA-binding transcriptional regulator [Naasia sp. SYSU D00948]
MSHPNGRRPATIEDVAREAGVSRAAVSKVLRNAYGVSEGMRTRVGAAIEHLNYRPRIAARAMRGSSFTLGIEIPDFANQFFTMVLAGATTALEGTDYQLIIAPAAGGPGREGYRAIEALADRQVDGVVAISPQVSTNWLERLAEHTPIVMLGRHDASEHYDTVVGDDSEGARLVMEHLLGLGHRRIAHLTRDEEVTAPGSGTPHSLRLETYIASMTESGNGGLVRVQRSGEGDVSAYESTLALLADDEPPTAIFAGHDELAMGALRAVAEVDPGISVAGYDNVRVASHPAVSLTSVDQAGVRMGERAIRLLLERIAGRSEPVHEVIEPSLVVRGSTRPPSAGPPGS